MNEGTCTRHTALKQVPPVREPAVPAGAPQTERRRERWALRARPSDFMLQQSIVGFSENFTSYKLHRGKIIFKCFTWKLPVKLMALYPVFSFLSLIFVSLADVSPLSQVPILPCLGYLCRFLHSKLPLEGSCCLLNSAIHLLHTFLEWVLGGRSHERPLDSHSQWA